MYSISLVFGYRPTHTAHIFFTSTNRADSRLSRKRDFAESPPHCHLDVLLPKEREEYQNTLNRFKRREYASGQRRGPDVTTDPRDHVSSHHNVQFNVQVDPEEEKKIDDHRHDPHYEV